MAFIIKMPKITVNMPNKPKKVIFSPRIIIASIVTNMGEEVVMG